MNTERILHDLLLLDPHEWGMVGDPPHVELCDYMHRHRLRLWEVAEWLQVSESTVVRWRSGTHDMPWASWLALHATMYRRAVAVDLQAGAEKEQARAEFCANLTGNR